MKWEVGTWVRRVDYMGHDVRVMRVVKVLKNKVITSDEESWTLGGRRWGSGDALRCDQIFAVAEEEAQKLKAAFRRTKLVTAIRTSCPELPTEVLHQINEIIKQHLDGSEKGPQL